jgi:hypothetical protein
MANETLKRAIGVFSDRQSAEQALIDLKSMGFPTNKISAFAKTSDRENTSQPSPTRTIEATENEIRIAEPVLKRWGIFDWHVYNAA